MWKNWGTKFSARKIWTRQNCHIRLRVNFGAQILQADYLVPQFFHMFGGPCMLTMACYPVMPLKLISFFVMLLLWVKALHSCPSTYRSWVTVLGDDSVADEYKVEITASGNESEHMQICKVYSADRVDMKALTDPTCFAIHEIQVKQTRTKRIDSTEENRITFGTPYLIKLHYIIYPKN